MSARALAFLISMLVGSLVAVAGCGGSDDDDGASAGGGATATVAAAPPPPADDEPAAGGVTDAAFIGAFKRVSGSRWTRSRAARGR